MDSLHRVIENLRATWGPLTTGTAAACRDLLQALAQAPPDEPWLAELLREPPEGRELHRDPEHGFVLLAYAEREGLYRIPHDHGRGWVVYAVQHGELEMGTFARIEDAEASPRLVLRERYTVSAGECRVYLPGDIHDTRCRSREALLFRLTSCDLKLEEAEGRLTRYPEAAQREVQP